MRPVPDARLAPWLVAGALYAAVTVLMLTPFIGVSELSTGTFAGDGRLMVWTLAWPLEALRTGTPLFDAPFFHPTPEALRYTEHLLTPGLLSAPVTWLTGNAVLGCNLVWLFALWSNCLGAHALVWSVCRRHLPAVIAGLVFGWGFYRMLHLAHVHLQMTAGIPLLLLALADWRRRPTAARVMLVFAIAAFQVLTSWYIAVLTLCAGALWVLWLECVERRPALVQRMLWLSGAAVLGALVVTPLALPYARALVPSSPAEIRSLSADVASYVVPPTNTVAGQQLQGTLDTRWIWGEQTLFLGWLPLLLAIIGLAAATRASAPKVERTLVGYAMILGALAFGFSLGPSDTGVAPFDLFSAVPGLSLFRAPGRFGVLVLLGVAILAGFGALALTARLRSPAAALIVAVLGSVLLTEHYAVGSGLPRAESLPMPAIYRVLDTLPAGAVVSLPDHFQRADWPLRGDYLLFGVQHKRRIVNGFGRAEPPEYASIVEQLSAFPAQSAADLARALQVRYFVIHTTRLGTDEPVRAAQRSTVFRLRAQVGPDYLFSVE